MHELSICQALLEQVEALARQHGTDDVRRIVIQVGPLSGVEPALLAEAFLAARHGCAAQASLDFEPAAVQVRCRECGRESAAAAGRLLCGHCGGYRTRLLSGDELLLLRVELSTAEDTARVH